MSQTFQDPSKWNIFKRECYGHWAVHPPIGSFWGHSTFHETGEEAFADYRRQTEHIREDIRDSVPPIHISL